MIGREREEAEIDEVIGRRSGVVEFVGSAGLGKSRLMAAAESATLAAGLPLLRAGSNPYATAKPYGVIADLVEVETPEVARGSCRRSTW